MCEWLNQIKANLTLTGYRSRRYTFFVRLFCFNVEQCNGCERTFQLVLFKASLSNCGASITVMFIIKEKQCCQFTVTRLLQRTYYKLNENEAKCVNTKGKCNSFKSKLLVPKRNMVPRLFSASFEGKLNCKVLQSSFKI